MTSESVCVWKEWEHFDGDCGWSTTCGEDFCLLEGTPTENSYNYCPNCGGAIQEDGE